MMQTKGVTSIVHYLLTLYAFWMELIPCCFGFFFCLSKMFVVTPMCPSNGKYYFSKDRVVPFNFIPASLNESRYLSGIYPM